MVTQTEFTLREEFTTGIYYDIEGGTFCRLREVEDGSGVILLRADEDEEIIRLDPEEFREEHFVGVDRDAVEDPAGYLKELLGVMQQESQFPMPEDIAVDWAIKQTEIVEE